MSAPRCPWKTQAALCVPFFSGWQAGQEAQLVDNINLQLPRSFFDSLITNHYLAISFDAPLISHFPLSTAAL